MNRELILQKTLDYVGKIAASNLDPDVKKSFEVKKSFRTRSRELITEMRFKGLAYTLVLIASKSSTQAIEELLKSSDVDSMISMINNKAFKERSRLSGYEAVGYALYGATLLKIISEIGYLDTRNTVSLKKIIEDALNNSSLQVIALEVAKWIKRIAEAYIQG